jgi:hypothetical protein
VIALHFLNFSSIIFMIGGKRCDPYVMLVSAWWKKVFMHGETVIWKMLDDLYA